MDTDDRKKEIETKLGAMLPKFLPMEIGRLSNSILEHFRKREQEDTEQLFLLSARLKGNSELKIPPDPKAEERIQSIQSWRETRAKGIEFFELIREYGMISDAEDMVKSMFADRLKKPMKTADARVVEPKKLKEGGR